MARTNNQIPLSGPRGRGGSGRPPPGPSLSTNIRAEYTEHGCTVYGWPSTRGGVIVRSNCDIVELRYLGLEPLEAPASRHEDQASEDEFCDNLTKIGGRWWSSRKRFLYVTNEVFFPREEEPTDDELGLVWIGWPEGGGLLVLEDIRDALRDRQVGILRLATTMEERCRLLRDRLGATYFEDPMTYPGFAQLGSHGEIQVETYLP